MPDYSKGKIYKITSGKTDRLYIGSTALELKARFRGHKATHRELLKGKHHNSTSALILMYDDAKIELVENYACKSRRELEQREKYYIELYKDHAVNNKMFPSNVSDLVVATRLGEAYNLEYAALENRFNCLKCSESFSTSDELQNHSTIHDETMENEENKQIIIKADNKIKTPKLNKRTTKKSKCTICGKKFRGSHELKKHQERKFACNAPINNLPINPTADAQLPKGKKSRCAKCGKAFRGSHELNKHIERKFACVPGLNKKEPDNLKEAIEMIIDEKLNAFKIDIKTMMETFVSEMTGTKKRTVKHKPKTKKI